MSNIGRTIISALNQGDYQVVSQYPDLSDQDIKIINHYAHELFETAVSSKNLPLFQAILEIPRIQVNKKEYLVLLESVKAGLVEFVQELGRVNGLESNVRDPSKDTALILAQRGDWEEEKAKLLTGWVCALGGVVVNARGGEMKTALHHAMNNGWYEVAAILMQNGANPKIPDALEETPLNLALTADGIPGDLFTQMLGYDGPEPDELEGIDPPEEKADQQQPDPANSGPKAKDTPFPHVPPPVQAGPLPPEAFQKKNAPGVAVQPPLGSAQDPNVTQPMPDVVQPMGNPNNPVPRQQPISSPASLSQVPPPADDEPKIRTVTSSVGTLPQQPDIGFDPPEHFQQPVSQPDPTKRNAETIETVLGMEAGQQIEEVVTKDLMMSSSAEGGPIRLHHRAVLEQLIRVDQILKGIGQALTEPDVRQKDPVTEDTLWHAAAQHDQFLSTFRYLVGKGFWPQVNDFTAKNYQGLTVIDILDQRGRLKEVLSSNEWGQHPASLAHILANVPQQRRGAYASLIARTNLILRG